jgi:signal transduction histidine kinase
VLYALVKRETGSRRAGITAAGLFAATYQIGGAWLDLARVDSLFMLLTFAAMYLLRFGRSWQSWAWSGALFALAALTKQTAILIAGPMMLYAVITNWRRGLVLAVAFALIAGTATLLLDAVNRGWYVYYTVRLPAAIQDVGGIEANFWRQDMLAAMPVALAVTGAYLIACAFRRERPVLFYIVMTAALVGSSWTARIHLGAFDNVLIPAYAALSIVPALAVYNVPRFALDGGSALRNFATSLCLIQLVALVYDPRAHLPTAQHVELQRRLMQRLAETDGEVYVAQHAYFPLLAGKQSHAQSWAVTDIMRAGSPDDRDRLSQELHDAMATHRFKLIVLDRLDTWLEQDLGRYYHRIGDAFERDGLWTLTGYRTRPRWVYVPN